MASDPNLYYIGKGVVSFTPVGGTKRDLGNVPEFEITPNLETLDHFSSRSGVRSKDKSVVISKALTVRLVMEEWNAENLSMALLGEVTGDVIDIFSKNTIEGELEFVGANEVGAQMTILLHNVSFQPGSSLNPISDEWGTIEINGEALVSTTAGPTLGKFGTWTVASPSADDDPEPGRVLPRASPFHAHHKSRHARTTGHRPPLRGRRRERDRR